MEPTINHNISDRYQIIRCCYDPHLNISYIHIPKCGSSAVRHAIENSAGVDYYTYRIRNGSVTTAENLFTVIRDPLDRWISGFHQYVHNSGKLPYDQVQCGELIFDEHTLPMSEFLKGFDTDIKYFKFSTNVIAEINSYYELNLESSIVNVTPKPAEIRRATSDIMKTLKFRKQFKEIYAEDIKLWKSLDIEV